MERIERMARIYPQLMGRMGRMRTLVHDGMDLTYNQYKTLLTIADREDCSLGDLARELGVAMSSASQMVERLVGQGVVHREQDAGNRRQLVIRLTPAGEALVAELQRGILAGYARILERLGDEEQELLVQSFENIARILGKLT
ncbi:transcriptional regulator, MarR family [Desulfuromonas soudanensis]|uniref:Transcriptional regulator, MarR family n=1 Tax=Desulfuromonas soudanensis TaxID=1603606 RepID=A0A0M3QG57_9BACT|nr:MarR family transcriptional regulator [Desulfuromonas soudanensis]ALC17409.1 transcriptional regulator, MarR family [Desulfuromonas soudanensis]